MAIFSGGISGTLVKLRCPHCGTVQARARKRSSEKYACRHCHRHFTLAAGQKKPKPA